MTDLREDSDHSWDLLDAGGESLGTVVFRKANFPAWICNFEPTAWFEVYRAYFARHATAVAQQEHEYLLRHDEEFESKGFCFRSRLDASLPNPAMMEIFDLEASENLLSFRPSDEYFDAYERLNITREIAR
ncbi:hypothetical protein [Kumtagia ephedrae]|uniref:hypothetical protein n=1 Tax=Kumtagia ephedrae TaxID=2116701 RepID=UPI001056E31A|nr:hypothetical protein [Mesorhizobium ephedrae]